MADHLALLSMDTAALRRSATVTSFEPLSLLSALTMVTERIGLVATASTPFDSPYHIARRFASLDSLVHPDSSLPNLSLRLGVDASALRLDEPLPELPPSNQSQSAQQALVTLARERGLPYGNWPSTLATIDASSSPARHTKSPTAGKTGS